MDVEASADERRIFYTSQENVAEEEKYDVRNVFSGHQRVNSTAKAYCYRNSSHLSLQGIIPRFPGFQFRIGAAYCHSPRLLRFMYILVIKK